ncbi:2-dehydro-3-deoxygalactonokinase [Roseibium litorale]|uniref:2-dehydro-3-deoxygalactonokinase n=1 Tax=Roseibium litorale TaxID=2803841 RepID=A0ABR9CGL4_9HYPH|nr:2-dehydro-3-deoxygalactonokinase [Roseibium litorale]MBD8890033.1 2-dehydro-3-deoxygalactonokinase [Roseibium litorale]
MSGGGKIPNGPAAWFAVDWGTSHLRVWAMDGEDQVLTRIHSGKGMAGMAPEAYAPELLALAGPWLPASGSVYAVICGMAGSRQGWIEAPYLEVPVAPSSSGMVRAATGDHRLNAYIVPGLCQTAPADVMRGEETQIAGYLRKNPEFDGYLCLPGTHSKWVSVSGGKVQSFVTVMTGEMFALLGKTSVLRHSVAESGWSEAEFEKGVRQSLDHPERFIASLFAIRAEGLLANLGGEAARALLSGMIIGAELAASRSAWMDRPVVVIGEGALISIYQAALKAAGASAEVFSGDEATLSGLCAAYHFMKGTPS